MTLIQKNTGIIAGISIVVITLAFLVTVVLFPVNEAASIEEYIRNYNVSSVIPVIPSFLLVIANIPLFIALYFYANEDKRIFALIGIIFGTGYMINCSINYFIQLSAVNKSILSGNTAFIEPLLMYNPLSLAYSLDNLGYLFLSISFLFFSPIFSKGGLPSWIKTLFIITGISGILGCLGYLLNNSLLESLVFITAFPYILSIALLIFEFKKQ
jgi:hypothetical protein